MVDDWNTQRSFLRTGIAIYSLSSDAHRKLEDATYGRDLNESKISSGAGSSALVISLTITLILVMLWGCVRMLRYSGGLDGAAQNSSDNIRERIIANLTTKQRRDLFEAFFSDSSKAMASADLTKTKMQNSPLRKKVDSDMIHARSKGEEKYGNCSNDNYEVNLHASTDQTNHTNAYDISLDLELSFNTAPDTPVTTTSFESSESIDIEDCNLPTVRRQLFPIKYDNGEECADIFLVDPSENVSELEASHKDEVSGEGKNVHPDLNSTLQNERDDHLDEEEELVCPICLCDYEEGDSIIESKHCSHFFHKDCIFQWLEKHNICPVCREHMITPDEINEALSATINESTTVIDGNQ